MKLGLQRMRGFYMSTNILVVDDEKEIADLVELYLKMKTTWFINFIRPLKP